MQKHKKLNRGGKSLLERRAYGVGRQERKDKKIRRLVPKFPIIRRDKEKAVGSAYKTTQHYLGKMSIPVLGVGQRFSKCVRLFNKYVLCTY